MNRLKENAIAPVAGKYARFVAETVRRQGWLHTFADAAAEVVFDWRHGTETVRPRELTKLAVKSTALADGVQYQGANPRVARTLLGRLPALAGGGTFVDLGCGKGRGLLLAAEAGFREIVGVEFVPELAAICRSNLGRSRLLPGSTRPKVLDLDARKFLFPEGPLVVFMYNPFRGETLRGVAERLARRAEEGPTEVWVIYLNPCELEVFERLGFKAVEAVYRRKHCVGVTMQWAG